MQQGKMAERFDSPADPEWSGVAISREEWIKDPDAAFEFWITHSLSSGDREFARNSIAMYGSMLRAFQRFLSECCPKQNVLTVNADQIRRFLESLEGRGRTPPRRGREKKPPQATIVQRERLAQLDRLLRKTETGVPVRAGYLLATSNSYISYCGKVLCGTLCGEERTARDTGGFRVARMRGLDVIVAVLRREASARLISRLGQRVRRPRAGRFSSRSVASRSGMLAAVGAPPLDC
ncbi:site-specific integrase [Paraburkholderia sp. 40]|uniref:site-specific integrase n=1 Tax=Paraburkholderia sp. 40 TaxID=2991059 RepID=UPI003D25100C